MDGTRRLRLLPTGRRSERLIEHGAWNGARWPRVLIENADPAELHERVRVLQEAGYEVAACQGPTPVGEDAELCPLLVTGECSLVEGADVVVSSPNIRQSREIVSALERKRSPALVVESAACVYEGQNGGPALEVAPADERLRETVGHALHWGTVDVGEAGQGGGDLDTVA